MMKQDLERTLAQEQGGFRSNHRTAGRIVCLLGALAKAKLKNWPRLWALFYDYKCFFDTIKIELIARRLEEEEGIEYGKHLAAIAEGFAGQNRTFVCHDGKMMGPILAEPRAPQGSPWSLLLAILCLNKYSGLLRKVAEEKNGNMVLNIGGAVRNHVFFADDLMCFGRTKGMFGGDYQ